MNVYCRVSLYRFLPPIFHVNNHRKPDDDSDCHEKHDRDDVLVHGVDGGVGGGGGRGGGGDDDDDGIQGQGELLSSLVVVAPSSRWVLQSSQSGRTESGLSERPTPIQQPVQCSAE